MFILMLAKGKLTSGEARTVHERDVDTTADEVCTKPWKAQQPLYDSAARAIPQLPPPGTSGHLTGRIWHMEGAQHVCIHDDLLMFNLAVTPLTASPDTTTLLFVITSRILSPHLIAPKQSSHAGRQLCHPFNTCAECAKPSDESLERRSWSFTLRPSTDSSTRSSQRTPGCTSGILSSSWSLMK